MGFRELLFNRNPKRRPVASKKGYDDLNNMTDTAIETKDFKWDITTPGGRIPIKIYGHGLPARKKSQDEFDLADPDLWNNRVSFITDGIDKVLLKNRSKYCQLPDHIEIDIHMDKDNKPVQEISDKKGATPSDKDIKQDNKISDDKCIEVRTPRWSFKNIFIEDKTLDTIERTLTIAKFKEKLFNEWNLGNGNGSGRAIVLNFYGPSGTGKSLTGEAIAGELGKKVYAVNYSELESKYVGETPKNIKKVFEAAEKEDAVLIFDEADSFLGKRLTNVTQSADYGVNITRSVMLLELEKFNGIVIFTTNLEKNYDEAFKRRILADIPFSLPDKEARKAIWNIYLNHGMPLESNVTPALFADKYLGISGADIKDITLYAAVSALRRAGDNTTLTIDDFDRAYDVIIQRKSDGSSVIKVKHEKISEEQYKEETDGHYPNLDKGLQSDI